MNSTNKKVDSFVPPHLRKAEVNSQGFKAGADQKFVINNKSTTSKAWPDAKFVFGRKNYAVMLGSLGVIFLGMILMMLDKTEFGFGNLGLNVGPITILVGFGIGIVAIMIKDVPEEKV